MSNRKWDKIFNIFRSDEHKAKIKAQSKTDKEIGESPPAINLGDRAGNFALSAVKEKELPKVPIASDVRSAIFPLNLGTPSTKIPVPKLRDRIEETPQLALCLSLLAKSGHSVSSDPVIPSALLCLSENERAWIKTMEKEPVKKHEIHWLAEQLVRKFIEDGLKDNNSIVEITYMGPMLVEHHFQALLNCFIKEFENATVLNPTLLQGLIQLVQSATPGYLCVADLVDILATIRKRLRNTDGQSPENQYHLTLAVARILGIMAKLEIIEVDRVEHHEPLGEVLSSLRESSDPFLVYQASYAFQALQRISDGETALHEVMRRAGVVIVGLVKISGLVHLNLDKFLEGLGEIQSSIVETIAIGKNAFEGMRSLFESGQNVLSAIQGGANSTKKRNWYAGVVGAEAFVQEGRLADFKRLVLEAPCRRIPEFQWGICQLLGEIALDHIWEITTRQEAVDFLVELYTNDPDWPSDADAPVKSWMLTIFRVISEDPGQIITPEWILQGTRNNGDTKPVKHYHLKSRPSTPVVSPLLARVQRIPYVEYELNRLKSQRLEYLETQRNSDYTQAHIDPLAKINVEDSGEKPFLLREKVNEFLASDREVFLVMGDSGAGKSTFNRRLEYELLQQYRPGCDFPLFIHLPDTVNPKTALLLEQLQKHQFRQDTIEELSTQRRKFILICDGYDERQLQINLHQTNSFNLSGQWRVKLIISCRSTHLSGEYQDRFEPQPLVQYGPSRPHLFEVFTIVPFSESQIRTYVKQFVEGPNVHKLFNGRPIWSVDEYMDKFQSSLEVGSLVTNPLFLALSMRALPSIVDGDNNLKEVTLVSVYEAFVDHWLKLGEKRLWKMTLDEQEVATLNDLTEGGNFAQIAIEFLKELAAFIYREQDGNPVVRYEHREDEGTWKKDFFSRNNTKARLLRCASPLTSTGVLHRFIHHSLLEYFYSFEEHAVRLLRNKRLYDYISFHRVIYIPTMAKPSVQSDEIFPLMVQVQEFLSSDQQVFLVLGDSGAGKSTFFRYLENVLWQHYKEGGHVPLFVNLAHIDHPDQDLIGKQLRIHNLSELQIRELKRRAKFILICDGYDEAHTRANLFTNNFRHREQLDTKMLISCRTTFMRPGYRDYFQPRPSVGIPSLFTEAVIAPFSLHQIDDYVHQFVHDPKMREQISDRPIWTTSDYMDKLGSIPNLAALVHSPFLLDLLLRAMPEVVKNTTDLAKVKLTRLGLYDSFTDQWLQMNKLRLRTLNSSVDVEKALQEQSTTVEFLKRFAAAVFQGHDDYLLDSPGSGEGSWKSKFAELGPEITLLRAVNPLSHTGIQYEFVHRSLLEYFYSRHIHETYYSSRNLDEGPLSQGNLVREPSVIQFLAEYVQDDMAFKDFLFGLIVSSKLNIAASRAAANAITILVRAGTRFNGADLQGIKIPGADLSGGQFDSAQLGGADLRNTNLRNIWLRQANLSGAQMDGVQFGESDGTVPPWDVQTAKTDVIIKKSVTSMVFSPNGELIASCDEDSTVKLWGAWTGELVSTLGGHSDKVTSMAFSPSGQQIALGIGDKSVTLWDAQTGETIMVLFGHTKAVTSVEFSPSGELIASGSEDGTVRLWDAQTGAGVAAFMGHSEKVTGMAFSPSGQQIASGSRDKSVRLWDAQTDVATAVLQGHTKAVTSVEFSPSSELIASGSEDGTVRLWDAQTGELVTVLHGHASGVVRIAFSQRYQWIASVTSDETVQFWDVKSFRCMATKDLPGEIESIAWITIGHDSSIVTSCRDKSIRHWQIFNTNEDFGIQLKWLSGKDPQLNLSGATGFRKMNMGLKLLDAVSTPISLYELQDALPEAV